MSDGNNFKLVGMTVLRNAPQGVHIVEADPPIEVEQDDFIGIYYPRSTAENVIAQEMLADDAVEVYETPVRQAQRRAAADRSRHKSHGRIQYQGT